MERASAVVQLWGSRGRAARSARADRLSLELSLELSLGNVHLLIDGSVSSTSTSMDLSSQAVFRVQPCFGQAFFEPNPFSNPAFRAKPFFGSSLEFQS